MSITDAIINDMYQEHMRDVMREHHNAITTTEVEMKFDKVVGEIKALESYLGCFEREWGVGMRDLCNVLNTIRSQIDEQKLIFMNGTYNIGR